MYTTGNLSAGQRILIATAMYTHEPCDLTNRNHYFVGESASKCTQCKLDWRHYKAERDGGTCKHCGMEFEIGWGPVVEHPWREVVFSYHDMKLKDFVGGASWKKYSQVA